MTTTTSKDSRTVWFLDGTARILVGRTRGERGVAAVEVAMPQGSMPPLHVQDEDEAVYVQEGEVTFYIGDEIVHAEARDHVVMPRGVPHTYRVESAGGARWVTMTSPGRYVDFVLAVARPAQADGFPPASESGLAQAVAFTAAAAAHGIELVGAPGALPAPESVSPRPEPARVPLRERLAFALRPAVAPLPAC